MSFDIAVAKHNQETLLANKQRLLNHMRDVIADKRKCDTSYDQDKHRNIIFQIMIKELKRKIAYICKWNAISTRSHSQKVISRKNGNWTQMNLKKLALRVWQDEHQIRSVGADFVAFFL